MASACSAVSRSRPPSPIRPDQQKRKLPVCFLAGLKAQGNLALSRRFRSTCGALTDARAYLTEPFE
jgi:hypothetical protein